MKKKEIRGFEIRSIHYGCLSVRELIDAEKGSAWRVNYPPREKLQTNLQNSIRCCRILCVCVKTRKISPNKIRFEMNPKNSLSENK